MKKSVNKLELVDKKVEKALGAFTSILQELQGAIDELNAAKVKNEAAILDLQSFNEEASVKIDKYKNTKTKIENILG